MIQIRREPSARQRVIMRHCNVIRRAGGVQFHNTMNKFLIHARLSAGEKQLESVEVIIEVINNRRKAVVGICTVCSPAESALNPDKDFSKSSQKPFAAGSTSARYKLSLSG